MATDRRPARRRDRPYRILLARHRRSGTGQNSGQIHFAAKAVFVPVESI